MTEGQILTFTSLRMRWLKDKLDIHFIKRWLKDKLWLSLHQEWDDWRTNFDIHFIKNEMSEGQTLTFPSSRMRWLKDKLWLSLHQEWDDWRTNFDFPFIKNEMIEGQAWHSLHQECYYEMTEGQTMTFYFIKNKIAESQSMTITWPRMIWLKVKLWH